MLSAPRQPRWGLASQKSRPKLRTGRRCGSAGRAPAGGPAESPGRAPSMAVYQCRQPADDSASFSCAPASSWHPGIDATAAGTTGTLSGMLPRNTEASGAPMWMAPQVGGRFPEQGIRLLSFRACSTPASGEVCGTGRAGLWEAAEGRLRWQRAFSNWHDDGKYTPSASSCRHRHKQQCCPPCSCLAHSPRGKGYPGRIHG